tara:strand:+ start:199 stop:1266 length:1068 start_codon:yes stop_codon:yes gene_type:complete
MSSNTKPFTQINLEDLAGLRGLGASSILVYMALRIYGGKDSRAWPSQERISKDLNMPIGSVRRAMAQLRKQEAIIKTDAKTKSPTYQIRDLSIADMRCQKKPEDLNCEIPVSQIRDVNIADTRSEDLRSDPLIYKEYIKENIHLINKTHSTPKQIDSTDNKKRESSDSLEMDELDLLFVELWNKHSVTHGMTAKSGNPIQDWKRVKERVGIHQAERGLKTLDLKMSASGRAWQSFAGGRWVLKLEAWIKREDEKPIDRRDSKYLSGSIEVDRRDLNKHRQEAREAKEANERAQAIALESDTASRGLWREFRLNNQEWSDLVDAVQKWKQTFLTEELRKEIENDPHLEDFAMIINI